MTVFGMGTLEIVVVLLVDVGLPIHLTAANIDDRDNVPICNDPFNELDG